MNAVRDIFLSYRRDDSADVAGRISDVLSRTFGKDPLFYDVNAIGGGQDFAALIKSELPKCRATLILIGPQWTTISNQAGRRLDQSDDLVRVEAETAINTPGMLTIPVLINGAPMPRKSDLPASLGGLPALNARRVRRDPDFEHDMAAIVADLSAHGITAAARAHPETRIATKTVATKETHFHGPVDTAVTNVNGNVTINKDRK